MGYNNFSRPVTPVDQYLPISDEILARGAMETYNKAGQLGQKLAAYNSNLFNITTYGKDAEVLQNYENQFNQQVAELSKGDITSPQALSKFNSLVSNFSNSPDILGIHKRKVKFDEWNKQLQDYQEKGKFVPAWKMKQYNDAQDYYSGDKYYTDKQFTGNLTPGFDWDKHNKDLVTSTPEIEQLKKSGANNDLYKGKTYNALQGKFYEGLNQPGALDDLRQHFEYDYGNTDYATYDQQNAIEQVNKLNSIIQTSNDPILVNQAKADLDYWDDFATTVNPNTSKEEAFQRYVRSNAEDFARTNTNYALKESKMSDANKMYQEHQYRMQERSLEFSPEALAAKTELAENKLEMQKQMLQQKLEFQQKSLDAKIQAEASKTELQLKKLQAEIDAKKQKAESATSTKKEDFSPVSIGEIRTKFNNSQETAKKIKDILSKKATLVNKFDSSDIEKVEWDTDTKSYKVTLDVDGWDNGSNNIVFLSVNELNSALGEDSTSSPEDDPLGIK